ncbi:MAG: alpha/beta fold hydrolase [Bacteroidota bacterium]
MKLFYREYGEGNPLIILHGLYGSSDNWMSIAKTLSSDFRVIVPDLRNHGQSPHHEDHSYPSMTKDLLELFKSCGIDKAHILGHSMGGKLAMFFAAEYPDMVDKMIVADMSPRSYKNLSEPSGHVNFHLNLMDKLLQTDISSQDNFADVDETLSKYIADERLRGFFLKNIKKTDEGLEWKLNLKSLRDNLPEIMEGLYADDFATNKIRIPVLFLRAEKSDYISLDDFSFIRFIFPQSEIISIPDAGHWLHAEQPKLFIKNVRYFLQAQV